MAELSLENAISALKKKYPEAKPIGYFKTPKGYVLNTASEEGLISNTFFEVDKSGEVRVTNPILAKLAGKTIISI